MRTVIIALSAFIIALPSCAFGQQSAAGTISARDQAQAIAAWQKLSADQKTFLIQYAKPKGHPAASKKPLKHRAPVAVASVQDAKRATPHPAAVAADPAPPCENQSLFLRRDRTDIFSFLSPCGPSDEPGATISYTNNQLANTQSGSVQGLLGYVIARNDAQYAFGPSVYVNGSWAEPFKPATERSVIRTAFDTQFLAPTGDVTNYIDIAPYVQTDFRGIGRMVGIDALWEPYDIALLLGGRDDEQARRLVGFYWRLQPEADILHVETAGLTNFVSDTNYEFLGGTTQARMVLFQNMPEVGEFLCGRVYVDGTAQYFDNAATGRGISNYTAEVGYFLGSGVAPYWRFCVPPVDGKAPLPSASATASSISFVYSNGTDKTTLQNQQQYKVQFSFRF